ncbi:hypothetical protein [Viridibacillus arvi]|uniref:Uncharacterized protein n=1 Tax=Viridibacillus arvi TaxID=263475 RepID=A0A0M0L9S9_9BACL|nr:hypothetical protein [Viridibacillus arvi]KOO47799.1 hypothetical protein AMD00_19370 [Viridibacillus arvi]
MKANEEMLNSIILSIKPIYNELILKQEKIYEFRNFKPKNFSSYFWVYESYPIKYLKYIIRISEPIEYPLKLNGNSYGVDRFNSSEMNCKYAYKIEELYVIEEPISMDVLKSRFGFTPPQAYTYLQRNVELQNFIRSNVNLKQII